MSKESSLTSLELLWKAKRGCFAPAFQSARETLRKLDRAGYILGVAAPGESGTSYAHGDPVANTVSIHAWFIGPGAWPAALVESRREDGLFTIDDFGMSNPIPKVIDRSRGAHRPYPSCSVPLARKPRLRLCATAWSCCPPLLAADGGVIACWKLPLTTETRERLAEWNHWARLVASLMDPIGDDSPYARWARAEFARAKSWLKREGRTLADSIEQQTGLKVDRKAALFEVWAG